MHHVHLILFFMVPAVKIQCVVADTADGLVISDPTQSDDISLWDNANDDDGGLDLLDLDNDSSSGLAFNDIDDGNNNDNNNPALFADDSIFNNQEDSSSVGQNEAETTNFNLLAAAEKNQINSCSNNLQPPSRNRARSNEVCPDNQGTINELPINEDDDWFPTPGGLVTAREVESWFCPVRYFQGVLRIPVCNILNSGISPFPGLWASLASLPLKNLQRCWPCKSS